MGSRLGTSSEPPGAQRGPGARGRDEAPGCGALRACGFWTDGASRMSRCVTNGADGPGGFPPSGEALDASLIRFQQAYERAIAALEEAVACTGARGKIRPRVRAPTFVSPSCTGVHGARTGVLPEAEAFWRRPGPPRPVLPAQILLPPAPAGDLDSAESSSKWPCDERELVTFGHLHGLYLA